MNASTVTFPATTTLAPGEDAALARSFEAGVYAEYLISRYGPDDALAAVAAEGRDSFLRLWWIGAKVGIRLARRLAGPASEILDDLLQDAWLAVSESVARWDYRREAGFVTFTYRCVELALTAAGRNRPGSWSSSRGDRNAAGRVAKERLRLASLGEEVSLVEVARRLGISAAAATRGSTVTVELSSEPLADPTAALAFDAVDEVGLDFLDLLPPAHARVLRLRFGLDGPPLSVRELGAVLGVAPSTACRSVAAALVQARALLQAERTLVQGTPRVSRAPLIGASSEASPARSGARTGNGARMGP